MSVSSIQFIIWFSLLKLNLNVSVKVLLMMLSIEVFEHNQ